MGLIGKDILKQCITKNGDQKLAKAASYNLTAGKVFVRGKERSLPCTIGPQQMCVIVSRETVKVPVGYVGYAMPKTGLCFKGVLCLNTGIIDPGYDGRLSTVAINFDKEECEIEDGEQFLRLVVHRLADMTAVDPEREKSDEAYLEERKQDSKKFPLTFLDVPGQFQKIADKILGRQTNQVLFMLAVLAAVLGFITLGTWVWSESRVASTVERYVSFATGSTPSGVLERRLRAMQAQLDFLRDKVK
jgi:deoxycytidine triphosphate deaminase